MHIYGPLSILFKFCYAINLCCLASGIIDLEVHRHFKNNFRLPTCNNYLTTLVLTSAWKIWLCIYDINSLHVWSKFFTNKTWVPSYNSCRCYHYSTQVYNASAVDLCYGKIRMWHTEKIYIGLSQSYSNQKL